VRILIAGASGYVGQHVARLACDHKHDVIAHVRPDSRSGDTAAKSLRNSGCRIVRTPWTEPAWHDLLASERPDRLLLLIGTTAARTREAARAGVADASQKAVDLGLTELALSAAAHSAPDTGVLYLSALGASATGNEYLRVRATIEATLLRGSNPFTVVRPSFITGTDRGEARFGERWGARGVDAMCAILRAFGARRQAGRLASITGAGLAMILLTLAEDTLDGRVYELDDFRR
jgi:uncharacterized protein YbjT (DUF2867 family)